MKLKMAVFVAIAMGVLGYSKAAWGDVITWGTPQDIASASDVSTNGNLLVAQNGGSSNVLVVNGVSFAASSSHFPLGGFDSTIPSTGDASYDTLIRSFEFPFATSGTFTAPGAYVAGRTYEIQIWSANPGINAASDLTIDDGNGNSVDLDVAAGSIGGQYVVGTFVADDAVGPMLNLDGAVRLNAFQVRDVTPIAVPEPGSLALFSIAGLVGLVRRRKR